MDWVEIIKVQVTENTASRHCGNFLEEFIPSKNVQGLSNIRRYESIMIKGGHVIILNWSLQKSPVQSPVQSPVRRSELAKNIIHGLKQFGLVDHSAWIFPGSGKEKQVEDK